MLPIEVIERIFGFLDPALLYRQLLEPLDELDFGELSAVHHAAFQAVFGGTVIIRSLAPRWDLTKIFYSKPQMLRAFVVDGLKRGHDVLRRMMFYNSIKCVVPKEIAVVFAFKVGNRDEARCFERVLETLAYQHKGTWGPAIAIQLHYDTPTRGDMVIHSNRVVDRILALGDKVARFLVTNRSSDKNPGRRHMLYPSLFENLREVRLWNQGITSTMGQFKNLPSCLRLMDFSSNNITTLENLILPPLLEELYIEANSLVSLEGPDFARTNLRVLDASINALTTLEGIVLPNTLCVLKLNYNSLLEIGQPQIPPHLEVLGLSQNDFDHFEEITLPSSLMELHVATNRFKAFPEALFVTTPNLKILDVSDNLIDDLDELGWLPDSLSVLMLDNNEIDYSNLDNILTSHLSKLSMVQTGLVSLLNVRFPPCMREINMAKNEISEIVNVVFASPVVKLDLLGNKLRRFDLALTVDRLILAHNMLTSVGLTVPPGVTTLDLSGLELEAFTNDLVYNLPLSVRHLCLNHCRVREPRVLAVDFRALPRLELLYLELNNIEDISLAQYPCTLREISFEHNRIAEVPFHTFPTNIEVIKLNDNRVRDLVPLPYFPRIKYLGIFGDETELMRLGTHFSVP